ncbi:MULTISPECIES: pyridoxamine 5'-phosphate oxidase family protein [unclassified Kitasatospora]|uniref:helix-turn-helix domain-containing protein n=1 Tax=unclassified Kitasatospora TaxID=2633591 RepID=UPI00070E02A6|nr:MULTISPECIES: pyridoxamine 5'-phosphate oxidase family protein [unclassified Kitasatospora]KQV19306.1 hypothetical protein ASC99_24530 [Kitasatospora sp. Root107]KRB77581.1 hypothetical protein ASE03_00725 [Kitasatospora sp. Root187]
MNRPTHHTEPAEPPAGLARRITERQHRLGLTDEALCRQAGIAPAYLRQLLASGADFDPPSLQRVATALELTYRELLEGPGSPPPGQGPASAHPALIRLTPGQCWNLLGAGGIGRVALPAKAGPTILPVNYTVRAGSVVYRTDPHGAAAPGPESPASFQVDRTDEQKGTGWSVLLTGTAEPIDDLSEIRRLESAPGAEPWAGGNRPLWVRIRPDTVTGRRIGTVGPDGHLG